MCVDAREQPQVIPFLFLFIALCVGAHMCLACMLVEVRGKLTLLPLTLHPWDQTPLTLLSVKSQLTAAPS